VKVRYTAESQALVRKERSRWRKYRDSKGLFEEELEEGHRRRGGEEARHQRADDLRFQVRYVELDSRCGPPFVVRMAGGRQRRIK
jgi:hypothetical protein